MIKEPQIQPWLFLTLQCALNPQPVVRISSFSVNANENADMSLQKFGCQGIMTQRVRVTRRKFSIVMTSGTRKPSAFDNVPNEVLNLIISSIPLVDDFSPISYETDGSTRRIHQILALMHVSRQFRFAILQHEVWLGLHFEFEVLAFSTREDYYDQLFPTVYLE
jgi:hypothetical protein